jgi:hypothetical protein
MAFTAPADAPKKETVAVMSLKGSSGITKDECELISDRLRVEFFKTGFVDVMERDQMSEILKEQGFQQSGACSNEACMIEMGQILGVQKLVTGSIGRVGSLYLLNVRMIDIKTAKITQTVSEDVKGDLEDVVGRLPGVARQLYCPRDATAAKMQQPVREEERRETVREEEKKTEPRIESTPGSLDCDGRTFVEITPFPKSVLGFDMEDSDWKDAYDELADKIEDYIDTKVEAVRKASIDQSPGCNALVIRTQIESYSTRPAKLGQKEGILKMTFSFYDSPVAAEPSLKMTSEAIGERHWNDVKPFINACEEIGDQLGKDLKKSGALDKLNNRQK